VWTRRSRSRARSSSHLAGVFREARRQPRESRFEGSGRIEDALREVRGGDSTPPDYVDPRVPNLAEPSYGARGAPRSMPRRTYREALRLEPTHPDRPLRASATSGPAEVDQSIAIEAISRRRARDAARVSAVRTTNLARAARGARAHRRSAIGPLLPRRSTWHPRSVAALRGSSPSRNEAGRDDERCRTHARSCPRPRVRSRSGDVESDDRSALLRLGVRDRCAPCLGEIPCSPDVPRSPVDYKRTCPGC
jgi:hypothetical protein